ncbi:MAG: DUF2169 domain-containing protein [Polyangiaceae bacterium]
MRVYDRTPFLTGYEPTSRRPPQVELSLVVRATYALNESGELTLPKGFHPLSQGKLDADVFDEADVERAGAPIAPSDFADWKPHAEVIVRANCHTPGRQPLAECPVRVSVGDWSKALLAVGPRRHSRGVDAPATFTELPIDWTHAFGGPDEPRNPVGRGLASDELPNIEDAKARVRSRGDRPPPAGFGPINPAWAERATKLGKAYGSSYSSRAPWYAEDFDWTYFQSAPRDQWLPAPLRGDERIALLNLLPGGGEVVCALPGGRVRAFARSVGQTTSTEIAMVLDTLFADLIERRLYLTWRGLTPVRERDLSDVAAVMVIHEGAGEAPRDLGEIDAELTSFQLDPALAAAPPELQDAFRAVRGGAPAAAAPSDPTLDPLSRKLDERFGALLPEERAKIRAAILSVAERSKGAEGVDLLGALSKAVNDPPGPARCASSPANRPRVPTAALRRALGAAGTPRRAQRLRKRRRQRRRPPSGQAYRAISTSARRLQGPGWISPTWISRAAISAARTSAARTSRAAS